VREAGHPNVYRERARLVSDRAAPQPQSPLFELAAAGIAVKAGAWPSLRGASTWPLFTHSPLAAWQLQSGRGGGGVGS